ncbi:5' exonuclease Apollo [Dirofilaria immitis]
MICSSGQVGLIINNFIAIDRFDINSDIKYCFISSAHSRHCRWLINEWQCDGIYCSPITAKLLMISNRKKRYNFSNKWIRALDMNVWHEMNEFRIMLIDANHAPGSVMFIIEGKHNDDLGRILYTGFFRADTKFYQNTASLSVLQEKRFDVICIDSTYVDFIGQEFPTRRYSAKEAANLLRMLKYNRVDSVAIPVPIIGREGFLVNISRELKCKIWVHPERFEIAHILGINDYFSDTKEDTYIWTCSQIESQQVLFTTDSHIIKASMAPYITPNERLNNNREHMIQYSDHCSSAELRSFLSLLSFSRIIGIPNKLSRVVTYELQNLSLSGPEAEYSCKEEYVPEELLFNPFKVSWRIGLAFDYAFRKICDQLSAIENLSQLTTGGADDNESDVEMEEDRLDEMAISEDMEYKRDDSQIIKNFSQDSYVSNVTGRSSISTTGITLEILEDKYDVSVLLNYLANICYTDEKNDHDSIEDVELLEFLSDTDISKFFNDFDNLFEKYQERSLEIMSVGVMNQPYHVEENVSYDPLNAPMVSDVIYELLDYNPTLKFHQDDFASRQQTSVLNCTVLKDISENKN